MAKDSDHDNVRHLPAVREQDDSRALAPYDPYANTYTPDDEIDLREIWNTVVKYRWTILTVTGVVLATTVVATLLMRPVYQATALVEVLPDSRNAVKFENVQQVEYPQREFMQTQANILRSESVAKSVVEELDLQSHPEISGEITQRGVMSGVKQVLSVFRGGEAEASTGPGSEALRKERQVLKRFDDRLTVSPIRESNLFEVKFESFYPELASAAANAVVRQYMDLNEQRRFESTSGAKDFLQREIERVQAKLETSEKELTAFARKYKVVDLEDKSNIMEERLQELNNSLTRVQSERIAAQAAWEQARKGNVGQLSNILKETLIQDLKDQYTELRAEYFRLSRIYKPAYPKLQQVEAQMEEVKASLEEEIENLANSLEEDYQELSRREALLTQAVEEQKTELLNLKDRAIQYNILKREWETNRELYSGLLERMKEVGVAGGMEPNNISLIDEAATPIEPAKPNLVKNASLAGLLGLMGGLGLAFLMRYLDNTIRTPEEMERYLRLASLGLAPRIEPKDVPALARLATLAHDQLDNELSEAIRSVRTSLMFSSPHGAPRTLLVTSSTAGEGKTTTACNLAITMAQNGHKVLLVDADLRKPQANKVFDLPAAPGLTDHLVGSHTKCIRPTHINNLHVLPAGSNSPNPAELLSSSNMTTTIKAMMKMYDHVVIDCAPVLGLADAIITATKVDGVIMVVSAGKVSRDALRETVKRLRSVHAPLLGGVLNMVDLRSREYSYYKSYYYGYGEREERKRATA